MKTSYSENYSPHKLLLRVAIIVFETVQCYSNMSKCVTCTTAANSFTRALHLSYTENYIIQVYCTENHYTLHVVVQVCSKHCVSVCRQTKQATSCGIVNLNLILYT